MPWGLSLAAITVLRVEALFSSHVERIKRTTVRIGPHVRFSKTKLLYCLLSAGLISSVVTGAVSGFFKSPGKYEAVSFISSHEDFITIQLQIQSHNQKDHAHTHNLILIKVAVSN